MGGRITLPWLRPFLILALVLTTPLLLYWFGHVQYQMQEAQQQRFSMLAAITNQLRVRLDAQREIAERATCTEPDKAKSHLKSQFPGVKLEDGDQPTSPQRLKLTDNGRLELRVFDRARSCDVEKSASSSASSTTSSDSASSTTSTSSPSSTKPNDSAHTPKFIASIELNTAVEWSIAENTFEGLLLFNEAGNLVAQDRRLPAQPLGLPVPMHGSDEARTLSQYVLNNRGGSHSQLVGPDTDAYVTIGGIDYLPFLQRVSVDAGVVGTGVGKSAATKGSTIELIVCGLLQKNTLRQQAIALPPDTMVVVIAAVAFGLLCIPFLKLRFISPHERMRARDVWLLGGSLLCGTMLTMLVVLDVSSTTHLRERFDSGLKNFASNVHEKASYEAKNAVELLEANKAELSNSPKDSTTSLLTISTRSFARYMLFDTLTWVDNKGMQRVKWSARSVSTPLAPVRGRQYFSDAMSRHLIEGTDASFEAVVSYNTGVELGVFAIPVERAALETGTESYASAFASNGIVALATSFYSLNQPVVPQPYHFVALDKNGKVIFATSRESYFGEHFFENVTNGTALQRNASIAALNKRQDTAIENYSYHGKSFRMLVRPLPELNVTLVAYYDASVYQLMIARAFLIATVFSSLLTLTILICIRIAYCVFGCNALDWSWPSETKADVYVFGIAACVLMSLAYWFTWWILPSKLVMWALLLVPALTVVLMAYSFSENRWKWLSRRLNTQLSPLMPWSQHHYAKLYVTFAVIALLSYVGVPIYLVFDDAVATQAFAFGQSTRRQVDAAAFDLENSNEIQSVSLNRGGSKQMVNSPDCSSNEDVRCTHLERIYATIDNTPLYNGQRKEFGVYDDRCLRINALLVDRSCDDFAGKAVPGTDGATEIDADKQPAWNLATAQLARALTHDPELRRSFSNIISGRLPVPVHAFVRAQLLSLWFWFGLIALIVLLSLVVRSVSLHILGLRLINEGVLANEAEQDAEPRVLMLRPPRHVSDKVLKRYKTPGTAACCIDLNDDISVKEFLYRCESASCLLIQHLESRLHDSEWRAALLHAFAGTPKLTLISAVDPFHFLAQRLRETTEGLLGPDSKEVAELRVRCTAMQEELTRWSTMLDTMRKIRYAVDVNWLKAAFAQLPSPRQEEYRRAYDTDKKLLDPAGRRLKRKLQRLSDECKWDDELMAIGTRLLMRDDFAQYRWSQLVGFIVDAAEPYYRTRWDLCSRYEKLALVQLAQEGFVNPKNVELIRRLARRRLVIVDPCFRLFNDSFREFASQLESPERITFWERSGSSNMWSRISVPIYALAAMVVAILFYTEQSFLSDTLAIATAASGTLGSLRHLYAAIKPVAGGTQPA